MLKEPRSLVTAGILIALVALVFARARPAKKIRPELARAVLSLPYFPPPEPPIEVERAPDRSLPPEVDDVLALRCRRCHSTPPRHAAPFRLLTWDDLQVDRAGQPLFEHVARVIEAGIMPIMIPTNPPVEPLSSDEKKTLLDWIRAGAPRAVDGAPRREPASIPDTDGGR